MTAFREASICILKWGGYRDVISDIKAVPIYGRQVHPKKDQTPERIEYQITGHLLTLIERRENAKKSLGFYYCNE